jgi:hypothetical protein
MVTLTNSCCKTYDHNTNYNKITEESEDEDADEEQAEEETRVRRLLQRFIEDPAQGDAPRRCGVVLMELMRHQR